MFTVGIISDTHGKLSSSAFTALEGVDAIVHAGDIGDPAILVELACIAPVTAVRGNTDEERPLSALPALARVTLGGLRFTVTHEPRDLPRAGQDADVLVCGHTHVPLIGTRGTALWVNPGSASRARSGHGHSVALLTIIDGAATARIVTL